MNYLKNQLRKKLTLKEELVKHSKQINYVLSLASVLTKLF